MDVWIVSIFFVVIMNNTSMNVCVQIFVWMCVFVSHIHTHRSKIEQLI